LNGKNQESSNWLTPRVLEVDESYENYQQRMVNSKNPKNIGKKRPSNLTMQVKFKITGRRPEPATLEVVQTEKAAKYLPKRFENKSPLTGRHLRPEIIKALILQKKLLQELMQVCVDTLASFQTLSW
jgi:hypothetical protein